MKIYLSLLSALCIFTSVLFSAEMVEVSVEITEVNNDKANELGIKWTDSILTGENAVPGIAMTDIPSIFKVGDWVRFTTLNANLKLLVEKGAAQVLSKPKIATRSGTNAKLVVGGEIGIIATGTSGGSVTWKEYGIKTEVTPVILSNNYIDVTLKTEVSRLDWANTVTGVPGVSKREAVSSVKVKSGETIALAGLLETKKEENMSGIPLLSEIPILGRLFGSKKVVETKKNVLIFVTPKILD